MDAEHLILCSFLFQFYCNSPTSNTSEVSKILVRSGKNIKTKNKKSQNSKYQTYQTHMDPCMDSHGKLVYLPYIYLKCMVSHLGTYTIFPMGILRQKRVSETVGKIFNHRGTDREQTATGSQCKASRPSPRGSRTEGVWGEGNIALIHGLKTNMTGWKISI